MDDIKDLRSSISIRPVNKMQGKVTVIAVGEQDTPASVQVTIHDNIPASATIFSEYVLDKIAFPPRYGNQRKSSLSVTYRQDIPSTIGIKPNGKMSGIIEIVEPPKIVQKLTPTQDAFVREGVKTLNYGTEQTMLVGHSNGLNESYRSTIQFDLSTIPVDSEIQRATLRLYNSSANGFDQDIGIYQALSSWLEKGITWANQPFAGSFVSNSLVGKTEGFVEFDVKWLVEEWYSGTTTNDGFVIKALNESINQFVQFYTKETTNADYRPVLEVEYVSTVIPSFGEIEITSNIKVPSRKDLKSSIKVPLYDVKRDLLGKIRVKNPDTLLSSIEVSRYFLNSTIKVRHSDQIEIPGSLIARQKQTSDVSGNIFVSRDFVVSNIKVPYRNDIATSIIVQAFANSELWSNLTVSKPFIGGNITVTASNDLNSSLAIQQLTDSAITSNITVSKPSIPSSITVVFSSNVNSSISVRRTNAVKLNSSIFVPPRNDLTSKVTVVGASMMPGNIFIVSGYLKSSITIPAHAFKDLRSKANIRAKWISDMPSTIRIGGTEAIDDAYVFIM